MIGGKRKLSKWNKFVQKVYAEQHRKNKNFQFKDALKMASKMKKKGQYGGEHEENEELETFDETMMSEDDEPMTGGDEEDVEEMAEIDEMQGGRRRRRTRRRRRGSRRTRKHGRTRRHRRYRGGSNVL